MYFRISPTHPEISLKKKFPELKTWPEFKWGLPTPSPPLSGIPHPRKWPWTHTSLHADIQRFSAIPLVPRYSVMLFVGCYLCRLKKSFSQGCKWNVCFVYAEGLWDFCTSCVPSCLWSGSTLILSCGKLAHNNSWAKALIYDWPL